VKHMGVARQRVHTTPFLKPERVAANAYNDGMKSSFFFETQNVIFKVLLTISGKFEIDIGITTYKKR